MPRHRVDEIRSALLHEVYWANPSPVRDVATRFKMTRQGVQLHMRDLVDSGDVVTEGSVRWRQYRLKNKATARQKFVIDKKVTEDLVWNEFIRQHLVDLSPNEQDILHYGATEMVNNVIDHSGGDRIDVEIKRTVTSVDVHIRDDGVGMFQKIADALNLSDPRQSLLELSKGKFTTDPERHTGEGVFFTSRSFDRFVIRSSDLAFVHTARSDDWLVEMEDKGFTGTRVTMSLVVPSTRRMEEVFARFSSGPDEYRFAKTHVPLKLAMYGDESLVSRSSAKRVLSRVDRFDEVFLDFAGVRNAGQGFVDEIFRVFANAHPKINLVAINANEGVTMMIRRAQSARQEQADQQKLFEDN